MILRSAAASPFVRKVRIAAIALGLDRRIEIVAADSADPADTLRRQNPLGKIPTLMLDDGTALYDSRVIVEYLDHLAGGGRIIPAEPGARFATLRLQALADGIMDASVLLVYEGRWREAAKHEPRWIEHQSGKVDRALAALESESSTFDLKPVAWIGEIALACALGYGDLRFGGRWRENHPRLVRFLADFSAALPAFEATRAPP
jgi:glutathione S-transferase